MPKSGFPGGVNPEGTRHDISQSLAGVEQDGDIGWRTIAIQISNARIQVQKRTRINDVNITAVPIPEWVRRRNIGFDMEEIPRSPIKCGLRGFHPHLAKSRKELAKKEDKCRITVLHQASTIVKNLHPDSLKEFRDPGLSVAFPRKG